MKIDFTKQLKDLDGKTIVEKDGAITLKSICINSLMANYQDEKNLSGEEKFKRYELAMKISENGKDVDLKAEDISLIKQLVGKAFTPLVVGQTYKMLEDK